MAFDIDRIVAAMQSPDTETALSATAALEQAIKAELESDGTDWGPLVKQVLPALITGLGHAYKGIQVHAAHCLEFLSSRSEAVIPALRAAMTGPDSWRAWGAALVTARMGCWFPEVGPALSAAMGATDRDVRWAAAGFSLQLGQNYPEAVEMVKETLRADNPLARKMAAYCLGAMGAFAEVEPALAGRLDDPDRDVRRAVILALDKLPNVSAAVQQRIAAMRSDPDEFVQRTASAVAAKFGIA